MALIDPTSVASDIVTHVLLLVGTGVVVHFLRPFSRPAKPSWHYLARFTWKRKVSLSDGEVVELSGHVSGVEILNRARQKIGPVDIIFNKKPLQYEIEPPTRAFESMIGEHFQLRLEWIGPHDSVKVTTEDDKYSMVVDVRNDGELVQVDYSPRLVSRHDFAFPISALRWLSGVGLISSFLWAGYLAFFLIDLARALLIR